MTVDKYDFVGRHIYVTGEYETATSRLFRQLLRTGDRVLDIGANIGYFSLLALSLVKPDGHVYAFEASPHTAKFLRKNMLLNRVNSDFTFFEKAVTNKTGTVTFHEAREEHLGIASVRNLGSMVRSTIAVPAIAIDDISSEITTVRLIKLDVEGAELLALEGMRKLLSRDKPYIILELTDKYLRQVYGSGEEVIGFLKSMGYSLFLIGDEELTALDESESNQCNVLAVPIGCDVPSL